MEKKGQVVFYGLMLGLVIIILGLAIAPAIKESVTTARNSTDGDTIGMDCNNASISDYDKAACITTDLTIFYFVASLIFIGGAIITAKIIFD
jgi:hypothetical protein